MTGRFKDKSLPHYDERRGWRGGDRKTLYAFTDQRTGRVVVRPVYSTGGIGPACDVRVATAAEAMADGWPSGWTVARG